MWNIVDGPSFPVFFNSAPVNVIVTLTFQANQNGPTDGGPIFNAPPGTTSTSGLTPIVSIFPNQTITVSFDVAADGGFVFYGSGGGVSSYVTFELENILWGRG
jgi:hypothetical protein